MLPFRRWRSGGRGALACLLCIFLLTSLSGPALAQKGKTKSPKKKKGPVPTASASASGEPNLTNIPLPVGHEAKGLILPDFDLEGHLRGRFVAATARRLDEEHVSFQDLKITTFTPENQTDLQIDMHTSIFNLKTRVLSSNERGTVARADFNIVGDALDFDTDKRIGHMTGHVKMVIKSNSQLMEKAQQ